jgi:hypothetical protein
LKEKNKTKKPKKKRNKQTGIELLNLFPFFPFCVYQITFIFQCYWVVTMAVYNIVCLEIY